MTYLVKVFVELEAAAVLQVEKTFEAGINKSKIATGEIAVIADE